MAKTFSPLAPIAAAMFAALLTAGCQQQGSVVGNLPSPNFDGPTVLRPATPVAPPPPAPAVALTPRPALPKLPALPAPPGWVPQVASRSWRWIIVHHSATPTGGAAAFDAMHKAKGWDELGYDFVIGNGTDTADGLVEVGPRWAKQKWGAHTKTPDNRFNESGIGICLVGNFDVDRPSARQLQSLARLIAYLQKTYRIGSTDIIGHGDAKATDCPGRHMDVAQVRRLAAQLLAAETGRVLLDGPRAAASPDHELLIPAR